MFYLRYLCIVVSTT